MGEPDQTQRLERRLQRERAARLAAEAIAEKGTRELYEQAERLRLLEAVAVAANLSKSPRAALRRAVKLVCEYARWPVGHVYLVGRDGRFVCDRVWFGAHERSFRAFRRISREVAFRVGEGLPGRVMASARPAWITDLSTDGNFPRSEAALRGGLNSAFAFPVVV
ncbi:MAG: GAF domain-containing protein, partial [Caulobacteraceae bacterium]